METPFGLIGGLPRSAVCSSGDSRVRLIRVIPEQRPTSTREPGMDYRPKFANRGCLTSGDFQIGE